MLCAARHPRAKHYTDTGAQREPAGVYRRPTPALRLDQRQRHYYVHHHRVHADVQSRAMCCCCCCCCCCCRRFPCRSISAPAGSVEACGSKYVWERSAERRPRVGTERGRRFLRFLHHLLLHHHHLLHHLLLLLLLLLRGRAVVTPSCRAGCPAAAGRDAGGTQTPRRPGERNVNRARPSGTRRRRRRCCLRELPCAFPYRCPSACAVGATRLCHHRLLLRFVAMVPTWRGACAARLGRHAHTAPPAPPPRRTAPDCGAARRLVTRARRTLREHTWGRK